MLGLGGAGRGNALAGQPGVPAAWAGRGEHQAHGRLQQVPGEVSACAQPALAGFLGAGPGGQGADDELDEQVAVVNNAGILRDKMLFSMTEDDFDSVIAVHLRGTFAMTRHACAYWREEAKRGAGRGGRIINTTSGTGLFGTVGQANYGAAKAGIVSLTTITALEMARYGVTANAISPIALTRMTDGIAGVTARNPVAAGPEGFDPRDPANASGLVVYLASDAAAWLTGQVFRVDGSRVQRLRGWKAAGEYRSRSGGAVQPGELIAGLPEVYGTAPAGRLPDPLVHGLGLGA